MSGKIKFIDVFLFISMHISFVLFPQIVQKTDVRREKFERPFDS